MSRSRFRELVEKAKAIAKAQKELLAEEFAYIVDINPYYAVRVFKAVAATDLNYVLQGTVLKYIGTDEKRGEEHGMESGD